MHSFAIFAINEHIAELQAEAARARLQPKLDRPNRILAALAAIRTALTAPTAPAPTLHAFHASK